MAKRNTALEDDVLSASAAAMEANEVDPDTLDTDDAPVVAPSGGVSLTFGQLKELLEANRGLSAEALVDMATKAAMAGADRIKPKELTIAQTERKSAYNPEGEKANPRPRLKCPMYFGSAPLGSPKEVTTLTHAEITALNGLVPGHYRIKKMDGSHMVVEIKGQMNSNRELDRLWILLPEGDENKNLYPPLADFASQCREATRVQPEVAA